MFVTGGAKWKGYFPRRNKEITQIERVKTNLFVTTILYQFTSVDDVIL